jgi:hypothetical protein
LISSATLAVLWLGCSGNTTTEPCSWTQESWEWDRAYFGHTPTNVAERWEGVHHFETTGLPLAPVALTDSSQAYTSGWTIALESSGPPVLRESSDCGSNVAIPFNWLIRLSGEQVESWGEGSKALDNRPSEGQVSIIGPLDEDIVLSLSPEVGDSSATDSYYQDYGRDQSVQPSLSFRSAGGTSILSAFQLHPTETSSSIRLVALTEEQ